MKIVVTCRTLNEEKNIERFCMSYTWADQILVADGGSTDKTIEIANSFYNVEVEPFTKKVERNGIWRNPHGEHINFMIDWAKVEGADWIIFDDCDCVPNYILKNDARCRINEASDWGKNFVYVTRLYVVGRNKHFERLAKPISHVKPVNNDWTPSLYAWKLSSGFRAKEDDPFVHEFIYSPPEDQIEKLMPPYCLLHYFSPDEEVVERKEQFYKKIRNSPEYIHSSKNNGSSVELPYWAKL